METYKNHAYHKSRMVTAMRTWDMSKMVTAMGTSKIHRNRNKMVTDISSETATVTATCILFLLQALHYITCTVSHLNFWKITVTSRE